MSRKRWTQLKLRTCLTGHICALAPLVSECDGRIRWGETYRDGGKGYRAHARCVRLAATDARSSALSELRSALAAQLFGLRLDRTKGAVN